MLGSLASLPAGVVSSGSVIDLVELALGVVIDNHFDVECYVGRLKWQESWGEVLGNLALLLLLTQQSSSSLFRFGGTLTVKSSHPSRTTPRLQCS